MPGDAVLGLDTATAATVAAVLRRDQVFEARDDPAPGDRPAHAARILGLAREAMAAAGVGWDDLVRIAVGVGPGSFTGLRIGVATARALAQAAGLPVAPVSTLAALAEAALRPAPGAAALAAPAAVLAVIDARRGEAFAAAWGPGLEPLAAPAPLGPEALADLAAALPAGTVAVGDGAVRFRAGLGAAGSFVPPDASPWHRVHGGAICRLGAEAPVVALDDLVPDYARAPDAELAASRP